MAYLTNTFSNLIHQSAFFSITFGNLIMIAVALLFLYLAIARGFEPLLLVPIAFGMLLVNIYPDIMLDPAKSADGSGGLLHYFYQLDEWGILPPLIFMGVGAMTDFGPLIANPMSFLLGAAAQFGIYAAYRHLGKTSIVSPTFNGAEAGWKGWEIGGQYTLAKNVVGSVLYFKGKTIADDAQNLHKIFSRVQFFF